MKNYEKPYMDVVKFECDVITSSGDGQIGNGGYGFGDGEDL